MSKLTRVIIGLLLLVAAFFGESVWQQLKNINITPNDPEVVVVVVTPPSESYKSLTKSIQGIDIDSADAKKISDFYGQLADVIRDDAVDQIIVQNKPFRDWYMKSGSLNFSSELKGKYAGLASAIDAVLMGTLGEEDIKWTPQMRKNAVDVCNAIAWAVHQ